MDPPHPLFQPVRVPRDVKVKQDVAALEVYPLSRGFGGYQDLNIPVLELLFDVDPSPRFLPGAWVHPAVDIAGPESPGLQLFHQVVQGVPELGENQEPLVGIIEEPLLLEDAVEPVEFRLRAGLLDRLRLGQPVAGVP